MLRDSLAINLSHCLTVVPPARIRTDWVGHPRFFAVCGMHGSLPGLAAGRFGVIMFFSFRVVAFLSRTRMFIFTKRFSVTSTRNHNHHQLGSITPTDGRVKGVS